MKGYKETLCQEMELLSQDSSVIFLGQQVGVEDFYTTLKNVPIEKRLEMCVAEELQLGMSLGLALEGFLPVSIYQRIDFLPRAADQLVNHLDIIAEMSRFKFNPRVIIRTTIGSHSPLNVGPQHNKNLIEGFSKLLKNIKVIELNTPDEIHEGYKFAKEYLYSTILVEKQDLYE